MNDKLKDMLEYYRTQSELSDPGDFDYLYEGLPDDIPSLIKAVQNVILHFFWVYTDQNYGISLKDIASTGRNPNEEHNLRKISDRLAKFVALKDEPIIVPREFTERTVGNCRDYSLLLISILRHKGIPARERSGVASYLHPPPKKFFEDHFVCEYWNEEEQKWFLVDAQIDDLQRKAMKVTFDTCDVPRDGFLGAGLSWTKIREGKIAPEQIGVGPYLGEKFARYKLIQDLASINKIEVMAWEHWGIWSSSEELTPELYEMMDKLAQDITNSGDPEIFFKLKELFENDIIFKVPENYKYNTANFDY